MDGLPNFLHTLKLIRLCLCFAMCFSVPAIGSEPPVIPGAASEVADQPHKKNGRDETNPKKTHVDGQPGVTAEAPISATDHQRKPTKHKDAGGDKSAKQTDVEAPNVAAESMVLRNLVSQETVAREAERMSDISEIQTVINTIAVVLLLGTLIYTARATNAAQISAQAAHNVVMMDRAYVTLGEPEFEVIRNPFGGLGSANTLLRWRNTGRSPAVDFEAIGKHKLVAAGSPPPTFDATPDDPNMIRGLTNIGPGEDYFMPFGLDMYELAELTGGQSDAFVYNVLKYSDIFGGRYEVQMTSKVALTAGVQNANLKFPLTLVPAGPQNGEREITNELQ